MNFKNIEPGEQISLFVKNIMFFEDESNSTETRIPFYADGYPGLMFQVTDRGLLVNPHNKQMPATFIYGQTIKPIELQIKGNYRLIVFQLFPFVLNRFFGINPKDINDSCYDMNQVPGWNDHEKNILMSQNHDDQIRHISDFLLEIFAAKKQDLDYRVREAVQLILNNKSRITIAQLCEKLHLTERTFERRFLKETGITARHFIQITRFRQSFEQLSEKDFKAVNDIVHTNGFSDQSHFIRVFKAFTGITPKAFLTRQG